MPLTLAQLRSVMWQGDNLVFLEVRFVFVQCFSRGEGQTLLGKEWGRVEPLPLKSPHPQLGGPGLPPQRQ